MIAMAVTRNKKKEVGKVTKVGRGKPFPCLGIKVRQRVNPTSAQFLFSGDRRVNTAARFFFSGIGDRLAIFPCFSKFRRLFLTLGKSSHISETCSKKVLLQEPKVIPVNCFAQPSGTICETLNNSIHWSGAIRATSFRTDGIGVLYHPPVTGCVGIHRNHGSTQLVDHSKGIHGQQSDQVINDRALFAVDLIRHVSVTLSSEDKRIPSIFPAGRVGQKESACYHPLKLTTTWFLDNVNFH
ncbi:hypothetical protein GHT06_022334 [Daphnia sinensis]|uniref:Uncharacterized protein n=1 Tax=Daphnia sinensis TaxID=1820382 RepID=A0AAD5KGY1_9CRUS|nr:hypothetical protein GHT06_022334 [Daphnia sinensis]